MKWSIILVLFLLAGCSREPVTNGSPGQIDGTKPQVTSTTFQPRKFSKGEALYINNCSDCHGWEGRGNGSAAKYLDVLTPILLREEILDKKSEDPFIERVLSGKAMKLGLAENAGPQSEAVVAGLLAHIRNFPSNDWDKIKAGQEVYDELCLSCHGLYGHGDGSLTSKMPGLFPDLSTTDYQTKHSEKELLQIITKGKDAMPGAEDVLNPEEIKAVIAFVRFLSPGYESYERFCSACHGANGSPVQMIALSDDEDGEQVINFENIDIPTLDAAYLNAHTDKQLIPKIQHMLLDDRAAMPHFSGDLKPEEVREIFQYLSGLLAEYP